MLPHTYRAGRRLHVRSSTLATMFDRIRFRLTFSYIGILALILVVFGTVVVVVFADQVAARQDYRLLQQARSKAATLKEGRVADFLPAPGEPQAVWARVAPAGRILSPPTVRVNPPAKVPSRKSVVPANEHPRPLKLLSEELAQRSASKKRILYSTIKGPEGDVRVVSLPVVQDGKVIAVVQVGEPREVVRGTVMRLILVLIPISLGALLLAAVGGLFMARRAMHPIQAAFDRHRSFIADASHELKTPLTLIRANAEVLARNPALADNQELAEDLVLETDRMNAVLSDLLLLARLDVGKVLIDDKPFDLGVIIAETAGRFKARAEGEGILLEAQIEGLLQARGYPAFAGQILAALLDNALRFTPSGGRVSILGRLAGDQAEAAVRDSGPGIAPMHLPYIFERFYRADAARTREGGGTGLGLAIARDLAHAQGGELTAESTEDGGAVFRLRLPRDTAG
jgi:signal transduction histidine kinase